MHAGIYSYRIEKNADMHKAVSIKIIIEMYYNDNGEKIIV